MLLLVENQQTINRSLRQCPKFGGGSSTLQKETKAQIAMMFLNIPATVAACKAGLIRFRPRMGGRRHPNWTLMRPRLSLGSW